MFERSIHRKRSFFVSSKFVNWLHGIFVLFFLCMLSLFLRPSITNIRMHTSKMLRTYTNIYVRLPFMLNLCSSKTFSWTFALIWSQQRWWVDLAFGHPLLHLAYFISFGSVRLFIHFSHSMWLPQVCNMEVYFGTWCREYDIWSGMKMGMGIEQVSRISWQHKSECQVVS